MIRYLAKIIKDDDRYSVTFADFPGCFSDGKSIEEASFNARDALSLYLADNVKAIAGIKPASDFDSGVQDMKAKKNKCHHWITPHVHIAIPLMIRQARLAQGLTQTELAKRLNISTQQIQKLETPGKSNPTIKTLAAISQALNEHIEIRLVA